jgi:hypothetical protein
VVSAGEARLAYDNARFRDVLTQYDREHASKLIWQYPPPVLLLVSPLALLPVLPASVAWAAATLAFFLYVALRVHPRWETAALIAGAPSVLRILSYGQVGFLFGAVLGLGLLRWAEGRRGRGAALLGLTTMKAHLAIFLPLVFLVRRDSRSLATFGLVGVVLFTAAGAILGWDCIRAFAVGVFSRSLDLLETHANYRLMASPYAALRAWGVASEPAFVGHFLIVLLVVGASLYLLRLEAPRRFQAALIIPTTLLISPYLYEYDLAPLALSLVILFRLRGSAGFGVMETAIAVWSAFALWFTPSLPSGVPIPLTVLLSVYLIAATKVARYRPGAGAAGAGAAADGGEATAYDDSRASRAPELPRPPGEARGEGNGHSGSDL